MTQSALFETPAQPTERNFYRCADCLSVVAVDGRRQRIQCACGGELEHMGRVEGDRLTQTKYLCPCDGRCTGALGPNCDCQCGGANHGSGRVVEVQVDAGRAVARPVNLAQAQIIAGEYRRAVAAAKARGWQPWKLRRVAEMKVHRNRMEALAR